MTTLDELLELGPELGRGAFGVVRRGTLRSDGTTVAVKLHGCLAPADHDRILREVHLLKGLSHPRLTRLLGCWPAPEGGLALVYEFVSGKTLEDHLAPGPCPLPEAVRIASELAEGLKALHQAGLIHRDLKPANVMNCPERGARLLDYGLVRAEGAGQTLTIEGQVLGTPSYMAPEQLSGARISPAADQYALGCLIFEMLTGAPPYQGELATVIDGHLRAEVPRLRALDPSLPMGLQPVLDQMLAKDPDQRFSDVLPAVAALRAASQPGPTGPAAATQVLNTPSHSKGASAPLAQARDAAQAIEKAGPATAQLTPPSRSPASPIPRPGTVLNRWTGGTAVALVALGFFLGPRLDSEPVPFPPSAETARAWFEEPLEPLQAKAPSRTVREIRLKNSGRKPLPTTRVALPTGHGRRSRLRGAPLPFGDGRFLVAGSKSGALQAYATRPLRPLRDYLVDHTSAPYELRPDGGMPLLAPGSGDHLWISGVTATGDFVHVQLPGSRIPPPRPPDQSPSLDLGTLAPEFLPEKTLVPSRAAIGSTSLRSVWEDDFTAVPRRYAGIANQSPELAWYADGRGPPRPCPVATGSLLRPVEDHRRSQAPNDHHANFLAAPMRPFRSLGGWVGGWNSVVRLSGQAQRDLLAGRRDVALPPPPMTLYYSSGPDQLRPAWILRLSGAFQAPPTPVPGGIALVQSGILRHYSDTVLAAPGTDGYVPADRGRKISEFPGLYSHSKAQYASAALWFHPRFGLDILIWKNATKEAGERIEWHRMPKYPEGTPKLIATMVPPTALGIAFAQLGKDGRDATGLRRVQRLAGGRAMLIGLTYTRTQSYFLVLDLRNLKVSSVLAVEGLETLRRGPVALPDEAVRGRYWLYATDSEGRMYEAEHTLSESLLR